MSMNVPIFVALSIDVEEEGLFSGQYRRDIVPLDNIKYLLKLKPVINLGGRLTLFCVYSAFKDEASRVILQEIRKRWSVEIGCHLHYWNTPPYEKDTPALLKKVPAKNLPNKLFEEKLQNLFSIAENFSKNARYSFRMGRWDLHKQHIPLLIKYGVKCDASFRPFHTNANDKDLNPDHYKIPDDPFWIANHDDKLFEVPLTVVPLFNKLPSICDRLGSFWRSSLKNWGALSLLPVYHPLWLMKLVTKMHIRNGGRALSLTWHSSEMMPKGAPHMPDEKHVEKLLEKIVLWMKWLCHNYQVNFVTMKEMREQLGSSSPTIQLENL